MLNKLSEKITNSKVIKILFRINPNQITHGSIKGKVINYFGHTVADADVFAEVTDEKNEIKVLGKSKSDSEGNFFIDNVPLGKGIITRAVKGKRDADHTDLTHRGSYGTGKDENNLIKITWRNPNVEGVQIPLIDVPGPKVMEFDLFVKTSEYSEQDILGRNFATKKVNTQSIKLPFDISFKPFPDIKFGKVSFFASILKINEDGKEELLDRNIVNQLETKIYFNGNVYDFENVPTFDLEKSLNNSNVQIYIKNLYAFESLKRIKVSFEVSIFQQEDKRKYVKLGSGYYILRR